MSHECEGEDYEVRPTRHRLRVGTVKLAPGRDEVADGAVFEMEYVGHWPFMRWAPVTEESRVRE